jgi:hypothetical protein
LDGAGDFGAVSGVFEIQINGKPLGSDLQSERRLAGLTRPQQNHGRGSKRR